MSFPDLSTIDTWVIDLDNTLYPSSLKLFSQVEHRIGEFIANLLNVSRESAHTLQKTYYTDFGTSLKGLMHIHNVAPEEFLEFVHDIDLSILTPDPELDHLLGNLPGRKLIYTNGSEGHARNIIRTMNIEHHFCDIYDSAAAGYAPKHHATVFERFVALLAIDPKRSIMIDDLASNLKPAHDLGLTTVWIQTERDWGAPQADGAKRQQSCVHADFQAPDLISFLRQIGS